MCCPTSCHYQLINISPQQQTSSSSIEMASLFKTVLVVLAATAVMAEPVRFRGNSRGSRFFARQEVAPSSSPAPAAGDAPYPAAGVTPSIPFELPNEPTTVQPDNTYLPPAPVPTPDNTYGPPQDTYGPPAPPKPDNQYGPPEAPAQPDNQYGPPAVAVAESVAGGEEQTLVDPRSQRIIVRQRNQKSQLRQQRFRSEPLRAARIQLEPVEIIRSRPVIHYSVQYKSF
ncbi:mucin-7-like [Episyrphus balteatus]|uniref:mucin-7-like n=1 Tax=Episyrphus balteatus TaxID=286459 RepID=UPI0024859F3F|nr:mucin-7-like [Episyrphus balteatus]